MKVRITFDVSDGYREAINHYVGKAGKASHAEVVDHINVVIIGDAETLQSDLPAEDEDDDPDNREGWR